MTLEKGRGLAWVQLLGRFDGSELGASLGFIEGTALGTHCPS